MWEKLSDGGAPGQCGWLTDKFGVSWQIVPSMHPADLAERRPRGHPARHARGHADEEARRREIATGLRGELNAMSKTHCGHHPWERQSRRAECGEECNRESESVRVLGQLQQRHGTDRTAPTATSGASLSKRERMHREAPGSMTSHRRSSTSLNCNRPSGPTEGEKHDQSVRIERARQIHLVRSDVERSSRRREVLFQGRRLDDRPERHERPALFVAQVRRRDGRRADADPRGGRQDGRAPGMDGLYRGRRRQGLRRQGQGRRRRHPSAADRDPECRHIRHRRRSERRRLPAVQRK